MAAGRIKGITIEIGGNTTKLVSSLAKVDSALSKTQANLRDINKALKFDPGNTALLKDRQNELARAVSETREKLDAEKEAYEQLSKADQTPDNVEHMRQLKTQIDLDTVALQDLEGQAKEASSVLGTQMQLAGQKIQDVGGKIESAGRAIAGISGAAAGALAGIGKLGYDAVTAADDLNTLSKQTGVSTDELQKWNYAADLVDVSTDTITGAMRKMKKNVDSNAKAFEALGVKTTYNSGRLRDSTDIFYDTIEALSHIQDETERDIAAMEIFGKSADDLAGVIDDGGAALKAYGKEAEELGVIIGGDTLNKLNETNDTIDRLKATMAGSFAQAGATIAQTFAPAVEKAATFAGMLAEKVRSLTPAQAEMIVKILAVVAAISPVLIVVGKLITSIGAIVGLVGKFVTFITPLISSIGGLQGLLAALTGPIGIVIAAVTALTAAFVYFYNTNEEFRNKVNAAIESVKAAFAGFIAQVQEWLPQILAWVAPIIEGIKSYLSGLAELAMAILGVLVSWIQEKIAAIQQWMADHQLFVQTTFSVIKTIVQTTLSLIQTIFSAFYNVLGSLTRAITAAIQGDWKTALENLKNAANTAINAVKRIFETLKGALKSIFSNIISAMRQWGRDMIDNLINGIKEKISKVKEAASEVAQAIRDFLHFSQPDIGPLADFSSYAPDMMKLFAQGITQNAGVITDAIEKSFNLQPVISGAMSQNNMALQGGAAQPIQVNITLEGDAQRLFRVLSEEAHRDWQVTGQSRLMGY